MKRRYEVPERTYDGLARDCEFVGGGSAGVRLLGRDGLDLRLAAPERELPVQRERLSMIGLLLAFFASGERPR